MNEYGFIETLFWKVTDGVVDKSGDPIYLSVDLEDNAASPLVMWLDADDASRLI